MDRRQFMGAAIAAPFAVRAATRQRFRSVLTTDIAVPHQDPDDFYDVACAVALGFHGVVVDRPHAAASTALREVGARELESRALRDADAVVVVGAATNAARHYRGQRVILFAGDVQGVDEANVLMDPDAYDYLRRKDALWIPCFDGGAWQGSERASWEETTDAAILDGLPIKWWFDKYVSDVYGTRNLFCGAYLGFATRDHVAGATINPFVRGPDLAGATRRLLLAA